MACAVLITSMELADQSQLTALLDSSAMQVRCSRPRVRRDAVRVLQGCEPPAHKAKKRMCRCGVCATCQDNARWERIFQSKFADPDYYVRRVIRHNSPLNCL